MRRIILGAIFVCCLTVPLFLANAQTKNPELQLQVLKYNNDQLQFRLGTQCELLYPGKTAELYLGSRKILSLVIEDGGESGMGLSQEKEINISSFSVLEIRTDVGTFVFKLDPSKLKSHAKKFVWISGDLKK
jgi:hypothetical protein